MAEATSGDPDPRIRTVGVPVRDQDRALTFYTTVLGFDTRMDVSLAGGARWIEVAPPGAAPRSLWSSSMTASRLASRPGSGFGTPDADAMPRCWPGRRRRRSAALARRAAHVRLP